MNKSQKYQMCCIAYWELEGSLQWWNFLEEEHHQCQMQCQTHPYHFYFITYFFFFAEYREKYTVKKERNEERETWKKNERRNARKESRVDVELIKFASFSVILLMMITYSRFYASLFLLFCFLLFWWDLFFLLVCRRNWSWKSMFSSPENSSPSNWSYTQATGRVLIDLISLSFRTSSIRHGLTFILFIYFLRYILNKILDEIVKWHYS